MIGATIPPLPIPNFFNREKVGQIWRVSYQQRAKDAQNWREKYQIKPAFQDQRRVGLLLIDVQNTFCIPTFELFVAGKSGNAAVEDNQRLCEFIYRNLSLITEITATMDTHTAMQIFHPIFWVNQDGEHPTPAATIINLEDVVRGVWKVNPSIVNSIAEGDYIALENYALHYVKKLSQDGKYPLTIWPYHSLLGGIGHALVSGVEEALFFHNLVRYSQTNFEMKGSNPLTENYSVLRPEVLEDAQGKTIAQKNSFLLKKLLKFDMLVITGQAKSHCLAWTIDDLLGEILRVNPQLATKIYLLADCTSPVVVPGVIDFTEQANAAFQRFATAGIKIIQSTDDLVSMKMR